MINLVFVGPLPPPTHGAAAVNASVYERLRAGGVEILTLDTAAHNLRRDVVARLGRLPRIFRALVSLAFARGRRGQALYMSVSGGFGQVYELLFVVLGRLHGMRLHLHHHSYAYLDCRSRLTTALLGVAGTEATHVVLSPGMARRLQAQYPRVRRAVAVSNAALLLEDATGVPIPRGRLGTIGFLGNLSAEKGVFVFLDVCAALQARGLLLRCLLAGPFQDAATEQAVRQRLAKLTNVEYLGSMYGADKVHFYAGIDVLLFPTRYVNEAEPLVIHEALAAGVPVIAYDRGAIGEIVDAACGLVVMRDADFVAAATMQLAAWWQFPESLAVSSAAATARFASLREASGRRWDAVQAQLIGMTPADTAHHATSV